MSTRHATGVIISLLLCPGFAAAQRVGMGGFHGGGGFYGGEFSRGPSMEGLTPGGYSRTSIPAFQGYSPHFSQPRAMMPGFQGFAGHYAVPRSSFVARGSGRFPASMPGMTGPQRFGPGFVPRSSWHPHRFGSPAVGARTLRAGPPAAPAFRSFIVRGPSPSGMATFRSFVGGGRFLGGTRAPFFVPSPGHLFFGRGFGFFSPFFFNRFFFFQPLFFPFFSFGFSPFFFPAPLFDPFFFSPFWFEPAPIVINNYPPPPACPYDDYYGRAMVQEEAPGGTYSNESQPSSENEVSASREEGQELSQGSSYVYDWSSPQVIEQGSPFPTGGESQEAAPAPHPSANEVVVPSGHHLLTISVGGARYTGSPEEF